MRPARRGRHTLLRLRLQLARDPKPAIVTALLVASGLVAAIVLVAALEARLPWEHRYSARIAVRDAAGIVPHSASVRIAGVPVGRVTDVTIADRHPVLTVELDAGRGPLYRDARAQIRPGTPLNDRYVDIVDRGSRRAGVLGRGDVLPVARTAQPVDLSQVLDIFDARVRTRVRATTVALGEALGDHGAELRRALVALAPFLRAARDLAGEIAAREGETRRLVHNLGRMTAEVAGRDRRLARLVRSAGALFDELGDRSSPLAQLLTELPATLAEVPPAFAAVEDLADHADPALVALRPVAAALPKGLETLERLAPAVRSSSDALDTSIEPLRRLLAETAPFARTLASGLTRLAPQVTRQDRMVARAKPCQRAIGAYFQQWLSVYKLYDDLGVLTHAKSTVAASSVAGTDDPALTTVRSCTGATAP